MTRKQELILLAFDQIIGVIQDDLDGGERIMKEIWEECQNKKELNIIKEEMEEIIQMLTEKRRRKTYAI